MDLQWINASLKHSSNVYNKHVSAFQFTIFKPKYTHANDIACYRFLLTEWLTDWLTGLIWRADMLNFNPSNHPPPVGKGGDWGKLDVNHTDRNRVLQKQMPRYTSIWQIAKYTTCQNKCAILSSPTYGRIRTITLRRTTWIAVIGVRKMRNKLHSGLTWLLSNGKFAELVMKNLKKLVISNICALLNYFYIIMLFYLMFYLLCSIVLLSITRIHL